MQLEPIQNKIYEIRGRKVMLDFDLAAIYQIENKYLKRAVRSNMERFEGEDFMFVVTREELSRCKNCTLNSGRGSNVKYLPFAFTELGVAMLSSVLNSSQAIKTNRDIMRAFVVARQLLTLPVSEVKLQELAYKIDEILHRQDKADSFMYEEFGRVYEIISEIAAQKRLQEATPRRKIGFRFPHENDDKK